MFCPTYAIASNGFCRSFFYPKFRTIDYVLVSLHPYWRQPPTGGRKFMIITFLIEHIYGNYS